MSSKQDRTLLFLHVKADIQGFPTKKPDENWTENSFTVNSSMSSYKFIRLGHNGLIILRHSLLRRIMLVCYYFYFLSDLFVRETQKKYCVRRENFSFFY